MSSPPSLRLQCPNRDCLNSENSVGQARCDRCQTPLVYRYLWAVGEGVEQLTPGTRIEDRYAISAPHVWLDIQPGLPPNAPAPLPDAALPYLHLYPYRLHLPGLYGIYTPTETAAPILLLDNVPLDANGKLFAPLDSLWTTVSPTRQLYWLWQLWQLWPSLKTQGVATSLLVPDNLRVEGWRVRLRELVSDRPSASASPHVPSPSLSDLATLWLTWSNDAHPQIRQPLQMLCQQLQSIGETATAIRSITAQLNQLLLEQAAQLPLRLEIAGATTSGPQRWHNEDACYPARSPLEDALLPQVGIICDGIGGHEGGEVASQLAVRSLQPLLRALLSELAEQPEPLLPTVVEQQLVEAVRVVNNQIAAQNDAQGRELRQRMGTTLMMALQLPQQITTPEGPKNAHELYLVHVGDSRAYWLTPWYCHLLTVDDDVVAREVQMGRSLYQVALQRSDSSALTQALGTHDADMLSITVQRFILEEDGILLLCSDGLSDHHRVEQAWEPLTRQVLEGKLSLEAAVQAWLEIANRQNGHDNTSVVLLRCQVSDSPQRFAPAPIEVVPPPVLEPEPKGLPLSTGNPDSELAESSRALLYDQPGEDDEEPIAPTPASTPTKPRHQWLFNLGLAALMVAAGALGMAIWQRLDPVGFRAVVEKLSGSSQSQ